MLDAGARARLVELVTSAVAAATQHSCALDREGTIWCWGDNGWGRLGVDDFERRITVQTVTPEGLRHIGPVAAMLAGLVLYFILAGIGLTSKKLDMEPAAE